MSLRRRSFSFKKLIYIVGPLAILLWFQNCAPVGESLEQVGSSVEDLSEVVDPNPGEGEIVSEEDNVPQEIIDVCADNKNPSLYGFLVSGNTVSTVPNKKVAIGIDEGSGTVLPSDLQIMGSPGQGESQALTLRCNTSPGNLLNIDCNNNGFVKQQDGNYVATIGINQRNNTQCVSGVVTVTVSARDACGVDTAESFSFKIDVADGCLPEQKVVAADPSINAKFGQAVSLDGNTGIVVAQGDGQNGHLSGAAYVVSNMNGRWQQTHKLMISDAQSSAGAEMSSAAISGSVIALGAPYHGNKGVVAVFKKSGEAWVQAQLLKPDATGNTDGYDDFGFSVGLSGDYLIVGAPADKTNGPQAGAAYIYKNVNGTFVFERKIFSLNPVAREMFGRSVGIDGSMAIVGAPVSSVFSSVGSGSAYVFAGANNWSGSELPYDGKAGDQFGFSVDISGGKAVVGAIKGTSSRDSRSGTAYVFSGQNYQSRLKLNGTFGAFGTDVAIDGNQVLVGAPLNSSRMGAAIYYLLDGSSGQTEPAFTNLARDRKDEEQFGFSVALSSGVALIGTWIDDLKSSETPDNSLIDNAGSVYLIEMP